VGIFLLNWRGVWYFGKFPLSVITGPVFIMLHPGCYPKILNIMPE
jgi:hypothetical protein